MTKNIDLIINDLIELRQSDYVKYRDKKEELGIATILPDIYRYGNRDIVKKLIAIETLDINHDCSQYKEPIPKDTPLLWIFYTHPSLWSEFPTLSVEDITNKLIYLFKNAHLKGIQADKSLEFVHVFLEKITLKKEDRVAVLLDFLGQTYQNRININVSNFLADKEEYLLPFYKKLLQETKNNNDQYICQLFSILKIDHNENYEHIKNIIFNHFNDIKYQITLDNGKENVDYFNLSGTIIIPKSPKNNDYGEYWLSLMFQDLDWWITNYPSELASELYFSNENQLELFRNKELLHESLINKILVELNKQGLFTIEDEWHKKLFEQSSIINAVLVLKSHCDKVIYSQDYFESLIKTRDIVQNDFNPCLGVLGNPILDFKDTVLTYLRKKEQFSFLDWSLLSSIFVAQKEYHNPINFINWLTELKFKQEFVKEFITTYQGAIQFIPNYIEVMPVILEKLMNNNVQIIDNNLELSI